MSGRLRLGGTLRYFAAWLLPWQPIFRSRAQMSGLIFYVHRRDYLGRHIAKYGIYEDTLTRWIAQRLATSPPGIFVDAGANIGWHALHAAQSPGVEAVVAFEPLPINAMLLDRNASANGEQKVILIVAALGARRGMTRLHRYKPSNFGRPSIVVDHGFGSLTVPVIDLDDALTDLGFGDRPVSILKIDVEGSEPAVLAGAERTLSRTGAIVVEFSPNLMRVGKPSLEEMVDLLARLNFEPFDLQADLTLTRVSRDWLMGFRGQMDTIWLPASAH